MARMFIFGLGYTASRIAAAVADMGWEVVGTGRAGSIDFDDGEAVIRELARATHILSSVPPEEGTGVDPVLAAYDTAIAEAEAGWVGYLSSTGVYGDVGGAWVDESAPIGRGRRQARAAADAAWQRLHRASHIFRLPGIYGPGRSALDRVRTGSAHRIDLPGQIFSRVHVDDIVSAVVASLSGAAGVYNLSDDEPAPQNDVIEAACALLGMEPPPLRSMDDAGLSPAARAFYAENRRVANGRAKRRLGWRPAYPDYRSGLRACLSAGRATPT